MSSDEAADGVDVATLINRLARPFLLPGSQSLGWDDVARRGGVEPEFVQRLWRAMGFADPEDTFPFNESDLEALAAATGLLERGLSRELLLRQARVVGPSIGRIAELFVDELSAWRAEGVADGEILSRLATQFDTTGLERLFGYILRRQLYGALLRRFADADGAEGGARPLAVGFVDLVGFTSMSQQFNEKQIADLAGRFEAVVFDTVVAGGGRFVKGAGDGAMFVADAAAVAATLALAVLRNLEGAGLPEARVGLSWGPAVSREGDYFGSVVNMASRIVSAAPARVVLVSPSLRDAAGAAATGWPAVGVHELKGIGPIELFRADDRATATP